MERITNFRASVLLVAVVLVLTLFSFILYSNQVAGGEDNRDNITTYITYSTVRAARGDILDANGNKLAGSRASYNLVFNHYVILNSDDPNGSLLELVRLCRNLGIEYNDHFPITTERPFTYTLSDFNAAWQGYFQKYLQSRGGLDSDITPQQLIKALRESYGIPEEWTDEDARLVLGMRYEISLRNGTVTNLPNFIFIEDATEAEMSAILELSVPGLRVEHSTVREYYTDYAAHVLGYIGPMDSQQLDKYTALGYPMDALVGQDGFEMAFEEYLHGTDGIRVDETTKDGTVVNSYYTKKPQAGNNVEVSIDLMMQMAAEDKLADVIENLRDTQKNNYGYGYKAQGGAVVAIDVKTGQVLVSGSYPTYDLSSFFDNYGEISNAEYAPLLNRTLMAAYPPGSTYKVSMVVSGIDSHTVTRYDTITDYGVYTKYDDFEAECMKWTDYKETHGTINSMEALMHSCNYYFYELADRMKIRDIDATAKGFGLGESTGVELSELIGHRANPQRKQDLFSGTDSAGWYAADQVMTGIGQSFNEFTPMQLAVYASTLANRGTRYKATFLNKVVSSDYRSLVMENQRQIMSTMNISDEAYAAYSTGMQWVVSESAGSAYQTFLNYPVKVAAKTGTAEVAGGDPHGAFICYAPAEDPQIAIAVYGERVGAGGIMGQVAKAILDVYFGIGAGSVDSYENKIN